MIRTIRTPIFHEVAELFTETEPVFVQSLSMHISKQDRPVIVPLPIAMADSALSFES